MRVWKVNEWVWDGFFWAEEGTTDWPAAGTQASKFSRAFSPDVVPAHMVGLISRGRQSLESGKTPRVAVEIPY